jgi:hypothetical protein
MQFNQKKHHSPVQIYAYKYEPYVQRFFLVSGTTLWNLLNLKWEGKTTQLSPLDQKLPTGGVGGIGTTWASHKTTEYRDGWLGLLSPRLSLERVWIYHIHNLVIHTHRRLYLPISKNSGYSPMDTSCPVDNIARPSYMHATPSLPICRPLPPFAFNQS